MNGNITVTLNADNDTIFVKPIILSPQVAMISISSIFHDTTFELNEYIQTRYINLGIVYDHRVINGYESNKFVIEIKRFLESISLESLI